MNPPRPALFGKLPSHGDFVARGLDGEGQAAWDGWASRGLEEAREALGEAFDAAHDQAPAWRFVVGPGPFGPGWRAGALAPSVDRVGRRYLIAALIDGLEAAAPDLAARCEDALYAAFENDMDADALLAALPADAACPTEQGASRWWTLGGPAHPATEIGGVDPPKLLLRALTPSPEVRAA